MSRDTQCAMWDFRMSQVIDEMPIDVDDIKTQLTKIAKRYCFQLEEGTTSGYRHFQGRFSLIKKHRKGELMKLFKDIPVPNYLEPTANATRLNGDYFYVMKDETRIEGPWDERTQVVYIPRQVRMITSLFPFQQKILDSAKVFDTRTINMIYCEHGNKGKTSISMIGHLLHGGVMLPPINDAVQLIQAAAGICMAKNMRQPSVFFVDMPRAMDKGRLYGVYSAIEQIKNGYLYDTRYKYVEWWIDSPAIWVFSNIKPDTKMLSMDRWKIWTINESNDLELFIE